MAVIPESLDLQWAGSTGSIDRDGPVEYMAHWRIQTDDPLDQVQTILIWWQLNVFGLGFPYAYANDLFGSLATAQNISATRLMETTRWWIVTVKYSRESDDSKQDQQDSHTTDPLEYRPIIRCSSNAVSKPGNLMKYEGGYSARVSAILNARELASPDPDGRIAPCNSAETPFDPFPLVNSFNWYISVEQNLATFDANQSFVGFTNFSVYEINYKGFHRGPIAQDQSKIRDCEVEFMRENTVDFWKVRYYIEVLADGETFLHHLVDRGLSAVAIDGRPDMHGGLFGAGGQDTPVPELARRAPVVAIVDSHELPLREPILFDGDGEALPSGSTETHIGIWSEDMRTDFELLPVIKEILKAP